MQINTYNEIGVKELAEKCRHEVFNIRDRIDLGLNYVSRVLDPGMNYLPYFDVFLTDPPEACHDWPDFGDMTGRFLEAMLLAKKIEYKKLCSGRRDAFNQHRRL